MSPSHTPPHVPFGSRPHGRNGSRVVVVVVEDVVVVISQGFGVQIRPSKKRPPTAKHWGRLTTAHWSKGPPGVLCVQHAEGGVVVVVVTGQLGDRKSTRLNSSHLGISYAVFCLKKKIEYSALHAIHDSEAPGRNGTRLYAPDRQLLDSDIAQYIHENNHDQLTEHPLLTAYVAST